MKTVLTLKFQMIQLAKVREDLYAKFSQYPFNTKSELFLLI